MFISSWMVTGLSPLLSLPTHAFLNTQFLLSANIQDNSLANICMCPVPATTLPNEPIWQVYLDERHVNWMTDAVLQHVLSDLRPQWVC